MAEEQLIGVTYTGSEDPFVDRIYRSRLTFEHGQTRELPPELAAKFLQHADVFQAAGEAKAKKPAKSKDDTQEQLEAAEKAESERREQENTRFEVHQQIDKMDKAAMRDFAKTNFKVDFPGALGEAKMREQVKGLVDQYGTP
ncbi:MAG TPA: hypothetical protein PLL72_01700 [Burkholderiaceae bacterium]|nr:hypothetical protein [Burkholderiaceae bacterium]